MSVVKRGNAWCVVHAHPQKKGSKRDKPPGTPIKCWSISKYGNAGARRRALAMHRAIAASQAAAQHCFLRADLQHMSEQEILAMVDPGVLQSIKQQDPAPVIKVYRIGEEGVAEGRLVGLGRKTFRYLQHAIRKLGEKLPLRVPVFNRHSQTNDHEGRERIGEVVGKAVQHVKDRLAVLAAIYILPSHRDKDLDIASIEANVQFSLDERGDVRVDDFERITGIALSHSSIEQPGFPGATLLGAMQAFATRDTHPGDRSMGAIDELTLEDVRKAIRQGGYEVTDLFDEEDILDLKIVRNHVKKEKQTEYEHAKRLEGRLAEERNSRLQREKELEDEISKLKRETFQASSSKLFEALAAERKLDDRQRKFMELRLSGFNPEKVEDQDAIKAELNKWIDAQLTEWQTLTELIAGEKQEGSEDKKDASTPPAPSVGAGTLGAQPLPETMDPAKNPLIPKIE